MVCSNCKKEVANGTAKFCPFCGGTLEKNDDVSIENGLQETTNSQIEEIVPVATKIEDVNEESIKPKNPEINSNNNLNENIKKQSRKEQSKKVKKVNTGIKNKYIGLIVGIVIVIVLAVIGCGTLYYIKGKVVKESNIKELLFAEHINIDGAEVKLSKKNIIDLTINDRSSKWRDYDNIESSMVIDLDDAEINVDAIIKLKFRDGEWQLKNIEVENINNVKLSNTSTKSLESDIMKCYFEYGDYDYIDLDSEVVQDISNIKVDIKKGLTGVLTAEVKLSNGIMEAKYKVQGEIEYSIYSSKWEIYDSMLESTVMEEEKIINGGDAKEFGEFVKTAFQYDELIEYKPQENKEGYKVWISEENISEVKVNDIKNENENIILDIEMKAASGVVKDIVIKGTISIEPSLVNPQIDEANLKIESLAYEEVPVDLIKKELKKYTIDGNLIDQATIDTFTAVKQGSTNGDDYICVNGTIKVGGETLEIQAQTSLNYNYDNNEYEWQIWGIYAKGDALYEEIS